MKALALSMVSRSMERPLTSSDRATSPRSGLWRAIAAVEVAVAAMVVLFDLSIPTLVLLAMAVVSLVVRGRGPGTLGLRRPVRPVRMAAEVLGLSVLWSVLVLALFIPVMEHLTGQQQDVSQFTKLQGNVPLLLLMLLLTWTLAAVGEEFAFRGYVQTRARDVLPAGPAGLVLAVLLSSVLFGLLHVEQGVIGVVIITIDAIFWSVLRHRYQTLWAAILAHGFNNSIGMVAYFIAGPFYGLW